MKSIFSTDIFRTFFETRAFLLEKRLELTGIRTLKVLREGTSSVLEADLLSEQRLVPELCKLWPNISVLCEEAENSGLATILPSGTILLPYKDDVSDLPDTMMSVDGLDGSALFANGETSLVAMSAGLIDRGIPTRGLVMMLDEGFLYHTGVTGEEGTFHGEHEIALVREQKRPLKDSLIGLDDNKAVDALFRRLVISKLMASRATRYPLNVPSVSGGIKVLQGKLAAYVTSNARHWDIAGVAALIKAAGMIIRCIDGSEVPWSMVRMPPIVIARDEEAFGHVYKEAREYRPGPLC